jgi:riboflavin kinase/FMN adenylyltransferase
VQIIRGIRGIRKETGPCVATIGNFDGVHLGHETVIRFLAERGEKLALPIIVVTFEPHPKEYFVPEFAPPRIAKLRDKIARLAKLGVDRFLVLQFDQALAYMRADEFVQQILVEGLGIQFLVVGDDFRFGFQREGDFSFLQQAGETFGFEVAQMPTCHLDGARVSSSRIRKALKHHDLDMAARLLGRYYRISGRVIHGEKLGRQLDFPTANISLPEYRLAVHGVYAVQVKGIGEEPLPGVANVGWRPTVNGIKPMLEVHIIDFGESLYGKYIAVDFRKHIRSEMKFSSLQELKYQIRQDIRVAKDFFS